MTLDMVFCNHLKFKKITKRDGRKFIITSLFLFVSIYSYANRVQAAATFQSYVYKYNYQEAVNDFVRIVRHPTIHGSGDTSLTTTDLFGRWSRGSNHFTPRPVPNETLEIKAWNFALPSESARTRWIIPDTISTQWIQSIFIDNVSDSNRVYSLSIWTVTDTSNIAGQLKAIYWLKKETNFRDTIDIPPVNYYMYLLPINLEHLNRTAINGDTVCLRIYKFGHDTLVTDTNFVVNRNFYTDAMKAAQNLYFPTQVLPRQVYDAATLSIIEPTADTLDSIVNFVPKAWVKNFGNAFESFNTRFRIDNFYNDLQSTSLAPGESILLNFAPVNYLNRNWQVFKCSTELFGDINKNNDKQQRNSFVVVKDVSLEQIIAPIGSIDSGLIITPRAVVRNRGNSSNERFWTLMRIGMYVDSVFISDLIPGQSQTVNFKQWTALPGNYYVTARVNVSDMNSANDSVVNSVSVGTQRGWFSILSLPDGLRPVKNGGGLVYTPSGVFAIKGNRSSEFYQSFAGFALWLARDGIPPGPKGKMPKDGACLTYDPMRNLIYLLKGGNTLEFLKYDITSMTWDTLPSVPAGTKKVKGGSFITYIPSINQVFLLKGNTMPPEAYLYDPALNLWNQIAQPLLFPSGKRYKKGTAGCATDSLVWVLKSKTNELYYYYPNGDTWILKERIPFVGRDMKNRKVKDGSALTAINDKIFAFKGGNTQDLWLYNITQNLWFQREDLPLGNSSKKIRSGAFLTNDNTVIYALKGNKTNEVWKYVPSDAKLSQSSSPEPQIYNSEIQKFDRISKSFAYYDGSRIRTNLSGKVGIYDVTGRNRGQYLIRDNKINIKFAPGVYLMLNDHGQRVKFFITK